MAEDWKPVPDWPDYQAGYWSGEILSPNGVVLKRGLDRKGYPRVTVYRDGKGSTKRVHVLVFLAHHRRLRKREQVRHLDGNKENCTAWNLKAGGQPEQERDKRHAGTSRVKRGMLREGSEEREKEWNRTEAYRARATRTSRTWPL